MRAGARQLNEAENLLSEAARAGRLREKLLERIEGIVRESVRPLEKIEGIKILHVDGVNGGNRPAMSPTRSSTRRCAIVYRRR